MNTILLVDDNQDNLYALSQRLVFEKMSTLTTTSGQEAISMAKENKPDLILLDIHMPLIDGFEICKLLKENQDTKHIPVIFLTAKYQEVNDRVKGLDLGADDYLIQPCDQKELMARIRAALRQKKIHDQIFGALLQNEKLANIGKLTSAIAHEINNPLSVISQGFELVKDDITDNECADVVEEGIDKIQSIIENLLDFHRPHNIMKSSLNLNTIFLESLNLARPRLINRFIRIICELDKNLPPMQGSMQQMSMISLNLILNAYEAMSKGDTLILGSRYQDGRIQVYVRDTGIGIPQENLPKVFDSFFTTKEKGTGIGLFLVKTMVENNNGQIQVSSQQGKGTEFVLTFPSLSSN